MLIGDDKIPLSEAVVTVLRSLPGKSACLGDLLAAVGGLDKKAAASILTHDLQAAVREAVAKGAVAVQYDKKRQVDVISLSE